METVLINLKEYEIPTKWEDIKLSQYIDLMTMDTGMTTTNKLAKMFNILGEVPIDATRKMSFQQVSELNKLLDFVTKPYNPSNLNEFEYKGETYFIESVAESEFGAYIDYEHYIEKMGMFKALPYLIAIMSRKHDEKYEDYDTVDRAQEFFSLPFTVAMDIAGFFLQNTINTNRLITLISLQKQGVVSMINSTNHLLNDMAGKGSYLKRLQIGMLQRLMKSLDKKQLL